MGLAELNSTVATLMPLYYNGNSEKVIHDIFRDEKRKM